MTMYRPSTGKPRSFGGQPPRRASEPRSAPPPVTRDVARKLWRDVCEAAGWDTATPDVDAARLAPALHRLNAAAFPLEGGDLRGLFAASVLDQMRLYAKATGADTRRRLAPVVAAGARMLLDLLIEQGAALATEARGRMGQRDE